MRFVAFGVSVGTRVREGIYATLQRLGIGDEAFHLIVASFIGLGAGCGAVLFLTLIESFHAFFFDGVHGLMGHSEYLVFVFPALGGLLIGPLIRRFPQEARGDGIPGVLETTALHGGIIRPRTVLLRSLTAAITIGSGGSVGREAPIAQIGAAIGSSVGQFLRMSGATMRSLIGCGAAGGIAAVFNAPIGGVFFALEVLLGDFSAQTFAPIVVSAILATAVSRGLWGNVLVFQVPPFKLQSAAQIGFSALVGVLCGLAAVLFVRALVSSEERFERTRFPEWLRPAIGGLLVGLIAIRFPEVLGTDSSTLTFATRALLPWFLLLWIVFLKILATALSLGSGGSGGVLGPSIFMGGLLGSAAGELLHAGWPAAAGLPGGYALVGMAAFLAPVIGAPITVTLILFEMTGNYRIILPLMAGVTASMIAYHRFLGHSLYKLALHKRGVDLVQGKEESILREMRVWDLELVEPATIAADTPFAEVVDRFTAGPVDYLYTVEGERELTGVVSFTDVRPHLREDGRRRPQIAAEVATPAPVCVTPDENLLEALGKFGYRNMAQLPVVADPHTRRLIGALRRQDLLEAYQRRLLPGRANGRTPGPGMATAPGRPAP